MKDLFFGLRDFLRHSYKKNGRNKREFLALRLQATITHDVLEGYQALVKKIAN